MPACCCLASWTSAWAWARSSSDTSPILAPDATASSPLPDLFRQSIYSQLAGYEDTHDAERLAEDPTSRMPASRKRREPRIAFTSTLHWFETEVLTAEPNYRGLLRLNTELVQHEATRPLGQRVTLDIDSSESPVHGAQEESAYNGHFESGCYHPLFVFNQEGDCRGSRAARGAAWHRAAPGPC